MKMRTYPFFKIFMTPEIEKKLEKRENFKKKFFDQNNQEGPNLHSGRCFR